MRTQFPRRLALWGGALALALTPSLASAQDGQPASNPPTPPPAGGDSPARRAAPTTPNPDAASLPPVPATAHDPAPPGTRGVRVDLPRRTLPAGATVPGGAPTTMRRAAPRGIHYVEGIVVKLEKPSKDLPGEQVRFILDPGQDWDAYIGRGLNDAAAPGSPEAPPTAVDPTTRRVDDASRRLDRAAEKIEKAAGKLDDAVEGKSPATDAPKAGKSADRVDLDKVKDKPIEAVRPDSDREEGPEGIELAITRTSYIFQVTRTPEGFDLYGDNTADAIPGTTASGRQGAGPAPNVPATGVGGDLPKSAPAPAIGPRPSNFTNIREGSYISARYRKVKGVNQVLNLSIIELPPGGVTPGEGAPGLRRQGNVAPAPGGTRPGVPAVGGAPVRVTGPPPTRAPRVPAETTPPSTNLP